MIDTHTQQEIIKAFKQETKLPIKSISVLLDRHDIGFLNQNTISTIIKKIQQEIEAAKIPEPIKVDKLLVKKRNPIADKVYFKFEKVKEYRDEKLFNEITKKDHRNKRDLKLLTLLLEITKLYTPQDKIPTESNIYDLSESGRLTEFVEDFIKSDHFKSLNIEKHKTLRSNQKIAIENILKSHYSHYKINMRSFWTTLSSFDYSKPRKK